MVDDRNSSARRKAVTGAEEKWCRTGGDGEPKKPVESARMERVERVRAAVQAGKYRVPASAVAAKILSAMLSRHP